MKWILTFRGKRAGAIGISETFVESRDATTEEEAWLALYDAFEHIQRIGARQGEAETAPQGEVETAPQCAGCTRAFGHGRALYVPTHKLWYHTKCFQASTLPEGVRACKRNPHDPEYERFAKADAKIVAEWKERTK